MPEMVSLHFLHLSERMSHLRSKSDRDFFFPAKQKGVAVVTDDIVLTKWTKSI